MLKSIAQPSPDLQAFIQSLNLPLNQAQEQHISQGADAMVTIDMHLYLRASTVRRLNQKRDPGQRLTFRSKIDIAHQMLEAVVPFIPTDCRVYVLFDSWYAATSLMLRRVGR